MPARRLCLKHVSRCLCVAVVSGGRPLCEGESGQYSDSRTPSYGRIPQLPRSPRHRPRAASGTLRREGPGNAGSNPPSDAHHCSPNCGRPHLHTSRSNQGSPPPSRDDPSCLRVSSIRLQHFEDIFLVVILETEVSYEAVFSVFRECRRRMVRSDRGMASAEVTEDNEDTHVKSGFGRVLGMASVFGVSSAGQR